jgi:proteasome lid subunit RPN8/RPN11
VKLTAEDVETIRRQQAANPAEEVCGLVMTHGLIPLINQARSNSRFVVGWPQVAEALQVNDDDPISEIQSKVDNVVGVYHTHPSGGIKASAVDKECMVSISDDWPGRFHYIVSGSSYSVWVVDDGKVRMTDEQHH